MRWNKIFFISILLLNLAPLLWIIGAGFWLESAENATSFSILYIKNTAYLIGGSVFLALIWAIPSAYLTAYYDFFAKQYIYIGLILPLSIPSYIMALTYRGIFDVTGHFYHFLVEKMNLTFLSSFLQKDIQNSFGLMLVLSLSLYPYLFLSLYTGFREKGRYLYEVGAQLGLSTWQIFKKIVFPLHYKCFFAGIILIVFEILNEYGASHYFGIPTLSTGIIKAWKAKNELFTALKLASYLLVFTISLLLFQYYKEKNHTSAHYPKDWNLKKINNFFDYFLFLFTLIPFILGFIFPVIQLLSWGFEVNWRHFELFSALQNTLVLGLIGTVLCLIFVIANGFLHPHFAYSPPLIPWQPYTLMGYSIPGSILAIGLWGPILLLDHALGKVFFSNSYFLLLMAYLIRFYAVGAQGLNAYLGHISPHFFASAASLGLSKLQIFWKIYLPLIRPQIGTMGLLIWIDTVKELPLTFALKGANFNTLATKIFEYAADEEPALAAAPAVLLIVLSVLVLLIKYQKIEKKIL